MATYLPTKNITVYTFVQKTGTSAQLQTALLAAFSGLGIQCFDDASISGNTLVVANGQAFSVAPNQYVGYNNGAWEVYPAAKMAGGANSVYTAYTP